MRKAKRKSKAHLPPQTMPQSVDGLQREMKNIKGLLMVLLVKLGADSAELGVALGVGSSAIRNIFPFRKIKKISPINGDINNRG